MHRLKFWTAKENFLLIEVLSDGVNGLLISLDSENHLSFQRSWHNGSWEDIAGWLGLNRLIKNIVVAADASLAYTALVPVRLQRENFKEELGATELEHRLAQEIGRAFTGCRVDAGRALQADDLDIVLVNSRVTDFRVDGHRVLHPIGFKAHQVEAMLELILTRRPILSDVKHFLKNRSNFFFTESTRAELIALRKTEQPPFQILRLDYDGSALAILNRKEEVARRPVAWSPGQLLQIIEREWKVSPAVARALYETYAARDMGAASLKFFGKLLDEAIAPLWKEIRQVRSRIYVETPLPLPFALPIRRNALELHYPPLAAILNRSGFSIDFAEWPWQTPLLFRKLAPFLAFYYDRSDSTVNRWLRRHLNWLGSPISHV